MTHDEFDQVYKESKCNGDRDKIIAFLFDQRKELRAQLAAGPDKVLRCAFCGHEYLQGTPDP